jgi:Tfp pilus assembly protein PilF
MPRWTPASIRTRMNARARAPRAAGTSDEARDILVLLLLAVLPYVNTLFSNFVYDDNLQVVANPFVHSFRHLREIFTTTVWSFQGAQGVTNYYRPLMTFSYLLCYKLFGAVPLGFHLVNIVWNAWVVCLVYWVARKMFRDRTAALIAAGLFALHPIHTESVAWIAAITDLQLSAFYLVVFSLYLGLSREHGENVTGLNVGKAGGDKPAYRQAGFRPYKPNTPGTRQLGRKLAIAGVYVLALLSKEQAVTLPALLTVYEHFFRDDRAITSTREKISRYLPLWGLAIFYVLIRVLFLGGMAAVRTRPGITNKEIILSAIALVGQYLGKLIWPAHLSAFYVFYKSSQWTDPRVLFGLGGLLCCGAAFLWLWKHARTAAFSFLWMGATLAPVLNARWMPASVFAERYLYLPSVGFCWLVGWGVARVLENARIPAFARAITAVVVGVAALVGGIATVRRNRDWRSEQSLFLETLATNPDSGLIRSNLGAVYFNEGDQAGAEREWDQALAAGPRSVFTLINFGVLRQRQSRYFEAQEFFQRAIRIRPDDMDGHLLYAEMLESLDRNTEADWQYRLAVTLDPYASNAHLAYGQFLQKLGRLEGAQTQFEAAVAEDDVAGAYDGLGDIYQTWNQTAQAEREFQMAVKAEPFDSHAHFGLGAIAAADGRSADAIREYRAGLEMDPSNADALAALKRLGVSP